jgi:hypothetical protein
MEEAKKRACRAAARVFLILELSGQTVPLVWRVPETDSVEAQADSSCEISGWEMGQVLI